VGWRRVRPAGKEGSLEGVGKIHNKISDNAMLNKHRKQPSEAPALSLPILTHAT